MSTVQYFRRPWLERFKEWWQLRNVDFSLSSRFSQGFMNRVGVSELRRIIYNQFCSHGQLFEKRITHLLSSPLKVELFQKPIYEAILSGEFESPDWDKHWSFEIRYVLSNGRMV